VITKKTQMKKRSLKRELRQAKELFWKAEAKVEKLVLKLHSLSITDKKWKQVKSDLDVARLDMNARQEEVFAAQADINEFQKKRRRK
jgi:hypothetical protein